MAVNESVPSPALATLSVFAAGLAPPAVPLNDSDVGVTASDRRSPAAARVPST